MMYLYYYLLLLSLITDWTRQGISFTSDGLRNILRNSIPLVLGSVSREIQRRCIQQAGAGMKKVSNELGKEDALGLLYGLLGTDTQERDLAFEEIFKFIESAEINGGKKVQFRETLYSCLTLFYAYCMILLNKEEFQNDESLTVGELGGDFFKTEEDKALDDLRKDFYTSPSKKVKE